MLVREAKPAVLLDDAIITVGEAECKAFDIARSEATKTAVTWIGVS